jgi:hypothetical protein
VHYPRETVTLVRLLASNDCVSLPAAAEATAARRDAAAFVRQYVEHHLDRRLKSYALVPR